MKTAIKTIVVLLLISVVAGLGWMTFGFREWDPEVWKGEIEDLTAQEPVVDGDGNELDPDGVNPLPTSMTFSSALNLAGEATSVTVKATIEPSTVQESFKALDWSVAWNNASSEWASVKTVTDYVTVTPTSDGAATATVACKQAFGEQIVLTCASRFFPNAKATATIDYRAQMTSLKVSYKTTRPLHITEDQYHLHPVYDILIDSTKDTFYIGKPTISREVHYPGEFYTDAWMSGWTWSTPELTYSTGTIGKVDGIADLRWEVKLDEGFLQEVDTLWKETDKYYKTKYELSGDWNTMGGVNFAQFFHINVTETGQELCAFDAAEVAGLNKYLSDCNENTEDAIMLWQVVINNALHSYLQDHDTFCQVRIYAKEILSDDYLAPMTFNVGLQGYTDNIDYVSSVSIDNSSIVF